MKLQLLHLNSSEWGVIRTVSGGMMSMRNGMEETKTLNLIKQKKSKENRENSKSFPTYHKIE